MNKKKCIFLTILIIFILIACWMVKTFRVIGTVSGLEQDYITIAGVRYEYDNADQYSSKDRKRFLGFAKVEGYDSYMRVWSVKGDKEGKYLYTLWFYDGAFYKKVE